MADNPPDFSQQLNQSKFHDQDTDQLNAQLDASRAGVGAIQNDWSGVKQTLASLATGQAFADARASGQGLTGAAATRLGQQDIGASNGSTGGLGQALLRLGSRLATQQNMQAAQAEQNQQNQALQQATELRMQTAEQQRQMFKANLELDNQKYTMQRSAKQAQDGLALFNVHLTNMFNQAVAGAKNAQELAQIRTNQQNFAQTMQYLTLGIGGASAAAAGAAQISSGMARRDDSNDGSIDLQQQGPDQYGGLTSSTNYGYYPTTPASPVGDFASAPQPDPGPNGFGRVQSFYNQEAQA